MMRDIFLISTIRAFFCSIAGYRAIIVCNPLTVGSYMRMILITFGIQTNIGTINIVGVRNAICHHTAVVVCLGINHFAILPNGSVTEVYSGFACIIARFTAKAKQTRAGFIIHNIFCVISFENGISGNVDGKTFDKAVIYVQYLFCGSTSIVHSAVIKNDGIIRFSVFIIDIDDLAGRVKHTVVKGHYGRAVRPERIISTRAVECGISECCSLITPVESLAVDHAVFNNSIVGADKAKVICAARTERHISKCNCSCPVKTVIAVVLCTEISWIRNFCTDIPPCFISSLTHKCQVFSLGVSLAGNTVQCVVAFTQLDGIATMCNNYSRIYRLISFVTGCADSLLRIITIYRIHVDCFATNRLHRKYAWCD